MAAHQVEPQTLEEKLIFWAITSTWGLWLLGALYLVGPLIGFALLALASGRWIGLLDPPEGSQPISIPIGVVIWIVGMAMMGLALVIAHLDWELGLGTMIKSLLGWVKGWALLAIFPLVGATLSIRPIVIARATSWLALQTLLLVPIFIAAGLLSLPQLLYVSPLSIVGGPGPEFFDVTLYSIDDTTGKLRWRFFAPWSTAVALICCLWLMMALEERWLIAKGVIVMAVVAICIMSGSRMSFVALPLVILMTLAMSNIMMMRPRYILVLALAVTCTILLLDPILLAYEEAVESFHSARIASSRVRRTIEAISYHRWSEAIWFGHGVMERGPKMIHYMPIGSHHTWYGLLFVRGAVGFAALAIPMAATFLELLAKSQTDRVARTALASLMMIFLFTLSDNIEIIAYLIWPTLILMGIAMRRPLHLPAGIRDLLMPAPAEPPRVSSSGLPSRS